MAESDTDDQQHDDDHEPDLTGELSDEDAERLLDDDADEGDDSGDSSSSRKPADKDLGKLQDELSKWKSLARRHERAYKDASGRLKKHEDKDKSEAERLQEAAQESRTRADRAEANLRRREIAEERAPEHASLAQIKAVAKRLAGESDEDMEADADELFSLLAPEPSKPRTPSRPKERLRGGGEPDEEPEESDPRKLADLIRKSR
jgi:hypothetical protein